MLELMINGDILQVTTAKADTMLLNYLREERHLTGTKEGCASGDCGACTVVVADLDENQSLRHRQMNSCITPLYSLHGKQVITVEYLKQGNKLHPVQQLVADKHGSQCGFCTPGFIMSLYALSKQIPLPEKPVDFLAGNLCRCTGYGPLIEAAQALASNPVNDPLAVYEEDVIRWMKSVAPLLSGQAHYVKPVTRQQLAQARRAFPQARIIAGGTDLSLEVTQKLNPLPELIDITEVDDLITIEKTSAGWRIGAAVPVYRVHNFMKQHFPSTDEILERMGSLAIRHRATLGGSLGNASPIGDIAPLLISLNGLIEVDDGSQRILFHPEDYIVGYRQTRLKADQWISAIHLPPLKTSQRHAIYKVSKRYEDDISTVVLAINITTDENHLISECIIAAGGVAAKSARLSSLEALFLNRPLSQSVIDNAKQHISDIIQPISDVRGSAGYRIRLMQNLLQRFYFETQNIATRVTRNA